MNTGTLRQHFPELTSGQCRVLAGKTHTCSVEGIDEALDYANTCLAGYGVEAIHDDGWSHYYLSIGLLYINRGDPYTPTLMFDTRSDTFVTAAWGDYIDSSAARRRRFAER
jgi:hypothetical protein